MRPYRPGCSRYRTVMDGGVVPSSGGPALCRDTRPRSLGAAVERKAVSSADQRRRSRRRLVLGGVLAAVAGLVTWWTVSVFVDGWLLLSHRLAWRFTARWSALLAAAT